jgi:glutamate-1-semialdehyde 2,1-aminomutase
MLLDGAKLEAIRLREVERFHLSTPRSRALYARSRALMPNGVPSSWMAAFYPGTQIFVAEGKGCRFRDVDGNSYLDMTQCDLSMVCGFGPEAIARAVAERFDSGSHFLLPTEDAIAVCALLVERFGMPYWQFTLSASAANTEAIRICRRATGRDKVLIFEGKYHGHIDETLVTASGERHVADHYGLPRNSADGTVVVPFNDLAALEKALRTGDIACILAEPVMTNMGVILPEDGFFAALRAMTRAHGALLIIDETHTQVAAYGGFTRRWQLEPDILTTGKALGGGVPIGAYGISAALKDLIESNTEPQTGEGMTLALGGTTYGNALNMAAARAALEHVLTEAAYARVEALGKKLADGIDGLLAAQGLPWRAFRLGNRSGVCLGTTLPRNAWEAAERVSRPLNLATRAFMANRGVWEPIYIHGPSVGFAHSAEDVDEYLDRLDHLLRELVSVH